MIYLNNNTETQAIYIPRQTVLSGGYIATTEKYEEGYNDGLKDGKEQQKGKLSNLNVTENGQYEREDGWNVVTVDVSIKYNTIADIYGSPSDSTVTFKGLVALSFEYGSGHHILFTDNTGSIILKNCQVPLKVGDECLVTATLRRHAISHISALFSPSIEVLSSNNYVVMPTDAVELTNLDDLYIPNEDGYAEMKYLYADGTVVRTPSFNLMRIETDATRPGFISLRGDFSDWESKLVKGDNIRVYMFTENASEDFWVTDIIKLGAEGGSCNLGAGVKEISENGSYNYSASDDGFDGYSSIEVRVNVPQSGEGGGCNLEDKSVTPSMSDRDVNNLIVVNPSEGYDGLSRVVIDPQTIYNEGVEAGRTEGGEGGSANLINPIIFTETEGNTINAESVQIPTFAYEGNQYYNAGFLNMADYEEFKIQTRFQPNNSGDAEPINIFGCEDTDWDGTTFGARIYQGQIYFRMSGQDVISPYTENTWYDVEMGYNTTKRWIIVNRETLLETNHTSFNRPSQTLMIGAINSGGNAFRPFYGKIAATYLEANGNQVWLLPKNEGYMDVYWNDKSLPWIQLNGENNARFENEYMSGDGMKSITWLGKRVDTTPSATDGMKFGNSTFEECPFNLEGIEDFSYLFENCKNLRTAPSIQKAIKNARNMFRGCSSLTTAPTYNTSEATDLGGIYAGCHNLTSVGAVDCSSLPNAIIGWNREASIFDTNQYSSLTDFGGFLNLKQTVDLSGLIALSNNSVENIFNNLYDFSGNGEAPNEIQGNITMSRFITDAVEQYRTIAESKGWTITIK